MAHLRARVGNDKKRNNGSFKPQGKRGVKKKRSNGNPEGHKNKYAEFSKASTAQARLEARKAADEALHRRQAQQDRRDRFGMRRFW